MLELDATAAAGRRSLLKAFLSGEMRAANPFPWAGALCPGDRETFYREMDEAWGDGSDPDWEEIEEIAAAWERDALEGGGPPDALPEETPMYEVILGGRERAALEKAPPAVREAAQALITGFLACRPARMAGTAPGKLKKFPDLGMVFQYQLPCGYRLRYRVDETCQRVEIEYLGPHK
ncbi:MAG: hypothetical protein IT210_18850 [Armatimonadetes bacterium]|nr:hypothetical protein [Armatimonadota bacterium]